MCFMIIKTDSIEALKNIINIVDIIGIHLELVKSGSQYKALCPFHNEKTPSMVISQNKGLYHCFGCGASGDSIKFLIEYEKINYREAVEKIASFYNFTLQYSNTQHNTKNDLLEKMAIFYTQQLARAQHILEYVRKRGISQNFQERFNLGYAPSNMDIMNFLNNTSTINMHDALKLGVVAEKQGKFYPFLKNRLIFPIYSPQGKIVGFGGRAIEQATQGTYAKYLNSPQTFLFNKSKLLYGYHLAKESIHKKKQIIITEGYIDVIMLHQAGFDNAVATLGTALNKDHIPLISQGEPQIIIAYDGDKPGRLAAFRASKLLAHKEGGVVLFSDGLDPADMVFQKKIPEIQNLLDTPTPFIEFVLREIVAQYDINNPFQKEKAFNESVSFLTNLPELIAESYKPLLASLLKTLPNLIEFKNKKTKKQQNKEIHFKNSAINAGLIKTLAETPSLLEEILEFIDTPFFPDFQEEFELLKKGDFHHPKILQITLNNNIPKLSEEELKKQICGILYTYYDNCFRYISQQKNIEAKKHSFILRRLMNKKQLLKKGEIPKYESFSTF